MFFIFAIISESFSTLVRDVWDRLQGTLSRTVWRACLRNLKFPHFYSWWFTDNTSSSEWRCTTQLTMFYGGRKHSLLGKVHLKKAWWRIICSWKCELPFLELIMKTKQKTYLIQSPINGAVSEFCTTVCTILHSYLHQWGWNAIGFREREKERQGHKPELRGKSYHHTLAPEPHLKLKAGQHFTRW